MENAESHVKIRILDPDFPQFAEKPTLIFGVAGVYFCDNRCFQKESKNSKFYQDLVRILILTCERQNVTERGALRVLENAELAESQARGKRASERATKRR